MSVHHSVHEQDRGHVDKDRALTRPSGKHGERFRAMHTAHSSGAA